MTKEDAALLVAQHVIVDSVEVCVPYKGDFLARVKFPSSTETDYDPFFLVNSKTGEVSEFSIMLVDNPAEVAEAFGVEPKK